MNKENKELSCKTLTREEAAELMDIPTQTLINYSAKGVGPKKHGKGGRWGKAYYLEHEVRGWIDSASKHWKRRGK